MAVENFRQPQFPWCTLVLVFSVVISQICVLVGNFKTATVMNELGHSTKGWSKVGVGVARSLEMELDEQMVNVSKMLLDGIAHVSFVQDALDGILSLVGNTTDATIDSSPEIALLQQGPAGIALLQKQQNANGTNHTSLESLTPLIMSAVHNVLQTVMEKVNTTLNDLLVKIKPALLQVGTWMLQFGNKIQAGIEAFSATLDKVQKIFDQIMSQLHGKGGNEELMLNQTFNLFDVTEDGLISAEDLKDVATLYSITALAGDLSDELVKKYDTEGDGKLSKDEMLLLVNDPAIPNSMSVVLRTYARRLAEIGGNIAAARQGDEVALAVVEYFQLVCAKNMTRVGWLADRLGNRSLPEAFTADVLIQLCLTEDDPNKLTMESAGQIVVGEMYRVHPRNTLEALDMLSNTSFWDAEGFDVQDQPLCMKRVTGWVTKAKKKMLQMTSDTKVTSILQESTPEPASILELIGLLGVKSEDGALLQTEDERALDALPDVAERLAEGSVDLFLLEKQQRERRRHNEYFGSHTSQMLLTKLLGGVSVRASTKGGSAAEQSGKRGVMARPETLEFARWLANNASSTAKERQQMCFDYSSQSSSAMDSFATQIQGMVSQIQGFIDQMMKYATPAGIEQLESDIKEFADKGMQDVMKLVETRILSVLNASSPQLEIAIHKAAHKAGEQLGQKLGSALATPLGDALSPALKGIVAEMTNSSSAANGLIGDELSKEIGQALANLTSKALAKEGGDLMEQLVDEVIKGGSGTADNLLKQLTGNNLVTPQAASLLSAAPGLHHLYPGPRTSRRLAKDQVAAMMGEDGSDIDKVLSLLSTTHRGPEDQVMEALSGVWNTLVNTLKSLMNTIPMAVSTLKYARKEVSKLHGNLNSIFSVFEEKGPQLFDTIAWYYRAIWLVYFMFLLPLNLFVLYYAFWACGYFGGPAALLQEVEEAEGPKTWREKCSVCMTSSTRWLQRYHDSNACFWSVVLFMQIIVLLIFIASIALCIISAVKALILAGCDQVYILADDTICSETLGTLRSWLSTFTVNHAEEPLTAVCEADGLLTCGLIKNKMMTSTILTTVFSLVSTILSLQLILDSAVLHEQARWRRLAHSLYLKEAASDQPGPSAASSSGS